MKRKNKKKSKLGSWVTGKHRSHSNGKRWRPHQGMLDRQVARLAKELCE